mgnify:CR=1 FL=1
MRSLFTATAFLILCYPGMALAAEPLSPWVRGVIEKAEKGIAFADTLGESPSCKNASDEKAKAAAREQATSEVARALRMFMETRNLLTPEQRELRGRTSCLRHDLVVLEEAMETVRQKMIDDIGQCKLLSASLLTSVYRMQSEAYQALILAGDDPTYESPILRRTYFFEDAQAFRQSAPTVDVAGSTAPLCPFTSDYAPQSVAYENGVGSSLVLYGCTPETLERVASPSELLEVQTQKAFMTKTQTISTKTYSFVYDFIATIDDLIAVIRGVSPEARTPPPTPLNFPLEHRTISDCLQLSSEDLVRSRAEAAARGNTLSAADQYVNDFLPSPYSPDYSSLPIGLLFSPSYDSLSIYENPTSAILAASDRRAKRAQSLALFEQPENLFTKNGSTVFQLVEQYELARTLGDIAANQARESVLMDAVSRDALERTQGAFSPLIEVTNDLGRITKHGGILTTYVRDTAYFLIRSCVDSFCQARLDTVLKRILNPYCHPFTSIYYRNDKAADRCYCSASEKGKWPEYGMYCEPTRPKGAPDPSGLGEEEGKW